MNANLFKRWFKKEGTILQKLAVFVMVSAIGLFLISCSTTEQGAAYGGTGGAIIGGALGGWPGAAIGGAAGAATGAAIGAAKENADAKKDNP